MSCIRWNNCVCYVSTKQIRQFVSMLVLITIKWYYTIFQDALFMSTVFCPLFHKLINIASLCFNLFLYCFWLYIENWPISRTHDFEQHSKVEIDHTLCLLFDYTFTHPLIAYYLHNLKLLISNFEMLNHLLYILSSFSKISSLLLN